VLEPLCVVAGGQVVTCQERLVRASTASTGDIGEPSMDPRAPGVVELFGEPIAECRVFEAEMNGPIADVAMEKPLVGETSNRSRKAFRDLEPLEYTLEMVDRQWFVGDRQDVDDVLFVIVELSIAITPEVGAIGGQRLHQSLESLRIAASRGDELVDDPLAMEVVAHGLSRALRQIERFDRGGGDLEREFAGGVDEDDGPLHAGSRLDVGYQLGDRIRNESFDEMLEYCAFALGGLARMEDEEIGRNGAAQRGPESAERMLDGTIVGGVPMEPLFGIASRREKVDEPSRGRIEFSLLLDGPSKFEYGLPKRAVGPPTSDRIEGEDEASVLNDVAPDFAQIAANP
jgi:hypothetical protein